MNAKINTVNPSLGLAGRPIEHRLERPLATSIFEMIFTLLSTWFVVGIFLDGWAHHHVAALETFFTPWHAVLYSGFLVLSLFLSLTMASHHAQGYPWSRSMPVGYELSLWGMIIFALSGGTDLLWHTLFGIEVNIEATLSPPHLGLIVGAVLLVTGPLRAAWSRSEISASAISRLPLTLSLTFMLAILTFVTQYLHPLVEPVAGGLYRSGSMWLGPALGIAGLLLHAALLVGLFLLIVRRWPMFPGGFLFTPIIGLSSLGLSFMEDTFELLPGLILAGVGIDLLYYLLKPAVSRPAAFRLFAMAVPMIWSTFYFLNLIQARGSWWSVHMISGVIFLTGITGWLLSYLVVPPAIPGEEAGISPDAGAG
jgi:hypothetical protein